MTITTYPVIFVKDPKKIIEFYEKFFGYQVIHINQDILNDDVEFVLEANDDRLSIIQSNTHKECTGIKVMTDNLIDCLKHYQDQGYEIIDGGNNETSKAIYLKLVDSYIVLSNHIK
ncbi:MAG: VOC family protein [Erysipelotrichaceae bacterium]|nr:VOC family protein [Erysipelotrichaceae bacterium]